MSCAVSAVLMHKHQHGRVRSNTQINQRLSGIKCCRSVETTWQQRHVWRKRRSILIQEHFASGQVWGWIFYAMWCSSEDFPENSQITAVKKPEKEQGWILQQDKKCQLNWTQTTFSENGCTDKHALPARTPQDFSLLEAFLQKKNKSSNHVNFKGYESP